jgi:hypothetical protein
VRAPCGEVAEFPLEQTTLENNSPLSADAGSIVRAPNASAIPSSDAQTTVAANGHDDRFCCGDDGTPAALVADIWFELDTGQYLRGRMKRSRPVAAR